MLCLVGGCCTLQNRKRKHEGWCYEMTSLAQTHDTNDIIIGDDGDIKLVSEREAYGTILADAIRTCLKEIQLDDSLGVPYFETVFRSYSSVPIWKMYVSRIVTGFGFVTSINSLDATIDNEKRKLLFSLDVETDKGRLIIEDGSSSNIDDGEDEPGDEMRLVQDGKFYLPVFLRNGIQFYRKLTEFDLEGSMVTQLSEELYIKRDGVFVRSTVDEV